MNKKEIKAREYLIKSMKVMHKQGFHGTSIKDITDMLGMPKGSFYNYFENKIDYTVKALELFFEYLDTNYFVILNDKELSPKERIIQLFEKQIKDFSNHESIYGCFIGNLSLELSGVDELLSPVIENLHERIKSKINRCLSESINSDSKRNEYISDIIMYTWQGSLMRYKSSNESKHLENFIRHLKDLLSNS
jgi:TetR/AcrR family transcriptional repressor of nem operon